MNSSALVAVEEASEEEEVSGRMVCRMEGRWKAAVVPRRRAAMERRTMLLFLLLVLLLSVECGEQQVEDETDDYL